MRTYLLAAATAALFALPLPASAATAPGVNSEVSAQTVVVRPGGVRVHGRWQSRERRMDRRRCTTETTTTMRRGREVTVRRKICR